MPAVLSALFSAHESFCLEYDQDVSISSCHMINMFMAVAVVHTQSKVIHHKARYSPAVSEVKVNAMRSRRHYGEP